MSEPSAEHFSAIAIGSPPSPSLGRLAWVFARFGNTVFGGGSATMAVLERQIVDRHQWLDRR